MQPYKAAPVAAAGPRSIFIVGGGPSAREFDFSALAGECVLAVNSAIFNIPQAAGVVSIDRNWITDNIASLVSYRGEWFLLARVGDVLPYAHGRQRCAHFTAEPNLSESWTAVHTMGCSGYAALNIAYLMRPKYIGLIGFDYDGSGKHWFDNETKRKNKSETWDQWAASFDSTVPQLQAAGIEVINYSDHSKITAFPRHPHAALHEYLREEAVCA